MVTPSIKDSYDNSDNQYYCTLLINKLPDYSYPARIKFVAVGKDGKYLEYTVNIMEK